MYAKLSPMLAPNKLLGMDIPFEELKFPYLLSTKYNGIRGLFLGKNLVSRTGKPVQIHPIVLSYFKAIQNYAEENDMVLDGEFHSNTFNTVGETRSILAGTKPLPRDFKFKCFYAMPRREWNVPEREMRLNLPPTVGLARYEGIVQIPLTNVEDLYQRIDMYKNRGIEGFMLLDPSSKYKHGRVTLKAKSLIKYKYYLDKEDAVIIGITARRERVSGGKVNPFGYAETSYSRKDFVDINVGGMLTVKNEVGEVFSVPFPLGYSLEDRRVSFEMFGKGGLYDLKSKWVCFRRLSCESEGKPISIKQVEVRDDKEQQEDER